MQNQADPSHHSDVRDQEVCSAAEAFAAMPDGSGHAELLPPLSDFPISLSAQRVVHDQPVLVSATRGDCIVFVLDGSISATVASQQKELSTGSAVLLGKGMSAEIMTTTTANLLRFDIDCATDTHASLGPREIFSTFDLSLALKATSNRSYVVVFGPENGSLHATLFAGIVPPGAAPWHFHQYDELVVILAGEGAFHHGSTVSPLGRGSSFRIPARDLHINENRSDTEDMLVIGLFTPAGSPSAAYLPKPN